MSNLTSKELASLEEQLNSETILIKKYRAFAEHCQDQMLKSKCSQIADRHQQHFNTLMSFLN